MEKVDKAAAAVVDLAVGQFEAVEAAARHEKQLVAAHEARGAQFAGEFPMFAQLPSLRVAAAFAGAGEFRADQGKPREIGRQQFHTVRRRQHHPQPAAAGDPEVALVLPLRQGEDQRRGRIARGLGQVQPIIVDDPAVTQQPTRHTLFP